jgi:putative nucleotidyltransferase with HDIG domain
MPQNQPALHGMEDFTELEQLWFGDLPDTDAEVAAAQSMLAETARLVGLHPFPETAAKILQLSRDPGCEVSALTKLIESDPSFAIKTLRLVNSAAFNVQVQCSSIGHAVSLLGNKAIGELAASWAVLDMFDRPDPRYLRLKQHATTVAALARHLATRLGLPAEDVYTCGLMHDLGKLLALEGNPTGYLKRLDASASKADELHLAERDLLGFDHALLAGHVMRQWEIPDPVPLVVGWHHQPARALEQGGEVARMVSLVRVADQLSYLLADASVEPDSAAAEIAREGSADYLRLNAEELERWWFDLAAVASEGKQLAGASPEQAEQSCHICEQTGAQGRCQECGEVYCEEHRSDVAETCSACGGHRAELPGGKEAVASIPRPVRNSSVVYITMAACVLAVVGLSLALLL